MLQVKAKKLNIVRISKVLARYNIKASISNSVITLSGDVSDDLLTKLCGSINIIAVQNFTGEESLYVQTENASAKSEESIQTEVVEKLSEVENTPVEETSNVDTTQSTTILLHNPSVYDLLYPEVKRGEIYWCDLGTQYGYELGSFNAEQENVNVDRPKAMAETEAPKERKDVNMVQVQLLSFVDINELLKISQSNSTDEVKAQRILDLFGFDSKKNGVQYLLSAIIASTKNAYFNIETLSESVSQTEGIDKEEIKRLIVARVKENFSFRKAPTIDFIRLASVLMKQEVNYEKNNI